MDVGYGQLAWSLRTDPRVTVLDRVNVRSLEPAQVAPPPSLVVADLSFISLALVLPALAFLAGAALLGGIGEYIARLGFSLSGALLFLRAP